MYISDDGPLSFIFCEPNVLRLYGPSFERTRWVQSFVQQNHEAALKAQGGGGGPPTRPPSIPPPTAAPPGGFRPPSPGGPGLRLPPPVQVCAIYLKLLFPCDGHVD